MAQVDQFSTRNAKIFPLPEAPLAKHSTTARGRILFQLVACHRHRPKNSRTIRASRKARA
jgi:hypothetical protein